MKKIVYIVCLYLIVSSVLIYSQNVKEEWVVRYNGSGNDTDRVSGIAVDGYGNVYVAGSSKGTGTGNDFVTIKYNSAGIELWVQRYTGKGNDDLNLQSITVDNEGNSYIIGWGLDNNYITIKYDTYGNELWVSYYDGPAKSWDWPMAITVDDNKNVYVTGQSGGKKGWEIATIKYNSFGIEEWVQRYNGVSYPEAITIDKKGNVYIAGSITVAEKNTNYLTIKYDSKGKQLWEKQYDGTDPEFSQDVANAIAIDQSGNVFITGQSRGKNSWWDFATVKYDSNGIQQWAKRYLGPGDGSSSGDQDIAESIILDKNGDIIIAGETGQMGGYAYTTIKYNTKGQLLWDRVLEHGWAYKIVLDNENNIYVVGYNNKNYEPWYSEYATIKYSPNGEQLWIKKFNDNGENYNYSNYIAIDKSNNIFVTGSNIDKKNKKYDFLTIKYSQDINNNNESHILSDAQKAYDEGKYALVIELLKDFPESSSLYDDALALMFKALGNIQSKSNQNFVTVYGRITNPRNINISGYIIFEDLISGSQVGKYRIGNNGYYCIVLPSGKRYSYFIDAAGFYPLSRIADFTSPAQSLNLNDNITLVSLDEMSEQQVSIRINNIFFDFNQSTLKPESFLELDRLYNVLNTNSDIKVEISGHTDNVGSDDYNNKLSQSRAESVKDYLVKKGINGSRIISKGYGKSNPVATNDTEEGRQLNRRVEFKILKK